MLSQRDIGDFGVLGIPMISSGRKEPSSSGTRRLSGFGTHISFCSVHALSIKLSA